MTCRPGGASRAATRSSGTTGTSGTASQAWSAVSTAGPSATDSCVIELTLTGTHDGDYRGSAPTGRTLELRICAHFDFDASGRIKRETAYYDSLTFMRQMGLTK